MHSWYAASGLSYARLYVYPDMCKWIWEVCGCLHGLPCQVMMLNNMLLTVPNVKWHATSDVHCTNNYTAIILENHVAMCSMWWSLAAKSDCAASDAFSAVNVQASGNIVVIAFCLHLSRLR